MANKTKQVKVQREMPETMYVGVDLEGDGLEENDEQLRVIFFDERVNFTAQSCHDDFGGCQHDYVTGDVERDGEMEEAQLRIDIGCVDITKAKDARELAKRLNQWADLKEGAKGRRKGAK